MVLVVKNPLANAGDLRRDTGSIPGLGRSPGGRHGNPLQHSFLENPMDNTAWWATVHRVAQIWTQLKRFSTHMKDKHLYLLSCCTLRKGNPSDAHMNMSIKCLKHALMGIFSFSMKPLEFTRIMKCPLNCALFVSLVARGLPG